MVGLYDVSRRSFVLRYLRNNKKPVWNEKNDIFVCFPESFWMAFDYFCMESNDGKNNFIIIL